VEKDVHNANKGMTFESAISLDNGSGSVQPWMATRKLGGIADEQGIFLRKYGRMSGKISFNIRDLNVETAVFSSFLQKPQNRKLLLDVGYGELKWRENAQKICIIHYFCYLISQDPGQNYLLIYKIVAYLIAT
jgi:hypothetical protein